MEIKAFIFLSLVVLNLLVSILIVRRSDLDSFQKAAQITMVWIIPGINRTVSLRKSPSILSDEYHR